MLLAPAGSRKGFSSLLGSAPFLRFDRSERTGALVDKALRQLKTQVHEFLELNSIETLVELVRQRVGISLLPLLRLARWEQDLTLRVLALPNPAPVRSMGLLYRREARGPLTEAMARQFSEQG